MPVAQTHTHTVPHELIIVFPAPVSCMHHNGKFTSFPNNKRTSPAMKLTFLWLILSIKKRIMSLAVTTE